MKIAVTANGLKKMEEDLINLKGKEMRIALEALSEAREKGDISENSEYEVAKENIDMLNIKIHSLEDRIKNSIVVNKTNIDAKTVQLFTNVKVINSKTKKEMNFSIVTDDEVDVKSGKISQNSPIAQGLIGQSKGKKVKINVPSGIIEFKILDITV